MHFRIVISRLSENVHNLPHRSLESSREFLYQNGYLHTLPFLLDRVVRNLHVIRHALVLDNHPSVLPGNLQKPNPRSCRTLDNTNNLTLISFLFVFLEDGNPHLVVVQGAPHLPYWNEYILSLVSLCAWARVLLRSHTYETVSSGSYFFYCPLSVRMQARCPSLCIPSHCHSGAAAGLLHPVNR